MAAESARRRTSASKEIFIVLAVALALSWLLKTFLVQAFYIPSGSMLDTLQLGDRILVNKLVPGVREPSRGDIIVFRDPENWLADRPAEPVTPITAVRSLLEFVGLAPARSGDDLVKRIIGVGGDQVVCCDSQNRVTVNGVPLDEPYLYPGDSPSTERFDVRVPEGSLWVMGDHRSDSQDSRAHRMARTKGYVPVGNVVGKALVVVWPLGNAQLLRRPHTFAQPALR